MGETGSTVIEESQTLLDEIEFTEGYTIDRGFVSPYFVKDQERQACEQLNPRVLVTDKKLDNVQEIVPLLEAMVKSKEPLFIVCEDIVGEALSALVVNKVRSCELRHSWEREPGVRFLLCVMLTFDRSRGRLFLSSSSSYFVVCRASTPCCRRRRLNAITFRRTCTLSHPFSTLLDSIPS